MSFPAYPKYKDSGVEWLGQIPDHWQVKRLRRVVELNPSKAEISHLPRELEVSFLPMEAIGEDGSLNLDRTKPIEDVETGYTYFRENDVSLAKITPCFENGKGAIMRGLHSGVGFGTTELIIARPNTDQISSEYLNYIFSSVEFRQNGEAAMYGAGGQKRISDDFVRDFQAPLPPPLEQNEITIFLDHEIAKIDALIQEQGEIINILQEAHSAAVYDAVVRGLDKNVEYRESGVDWLGLIPKHWDVISLSKASTKITNGYVGPTRDILVPSGVPYVQATHIKGGVIRFADEYFVTDDWSKLHSKSILEDGDVLVVQTGAGTGDVGLVRSSEVGFNCHALIIISTDKNTLSGQYLRDVLSSAYGKAKLASVQTGAMHPHLNCGEVKFIKVPLPPLDEQIKLSEYIEDMTIQFESIKSSAEESMNILQERKAGLINAAVTGKIDVRGWNESTNQ